MRKPLIAGNWKMYKTPAESLAFLDAFLPIIEGHERDEIVLFPTMTSLAYVLEATAGTNVRAGAQNMHWLNEGPYTGETSPTMLASIGCCHVLLGHSELRLYFGETYERVNLKLKAAINHGITPIVCVGEHLAEREAGNTEESCARRSAPPCATSPPEPAAPRHRLRARLGHRHRLHRHARDRRRGPRHHPPRARPCCGEQPSPTAPASSTAARSSRTTSPRSWRSRRSTAPWSAAPASSPPASPRSSTTPDGNPKNCHPERP
jgi:hypothetical protein